MLLTKENISTCDFKTGVIILIDKPIQFSSFFVVDKIKKALYRKTKEKIKIGHAGTLDPLATGLLILCTARKTKSISLFQEMEKTYSGHFTLGASTPSFDLETEISETADIEFIKKDDIEKVRQSFLGYQELIPPIHSAVKVNGKRAYKLARQGETPELKAKPIYISKFELDIEHFPECNFSISCSKGTYIRSIANEFGKRLNNLAYLSSLRRDSIGDYSVNKAFQLEEFLDNLMN